MVCVGLFKVVHSSQNSIVNLALLYVNISLAITIACALSIGTYGSLLLLLDMPSCYEQMVYRPKVCIGSLHRLT